MREGNFKAASEADAHVHIPFQCKTGNTPAELGILIEPDPHGVGNGTHAHFHTTILCPKINIVEAPEPDRCQVTNQTCNFWEPFGGYNRDPCLRKWLYAQRLIHTIARVEFYGTQLVNMIFKSKGLDMKGDLRLVEINRLLMVANSISQGIYGKIEKLRKKETN
jgi:hypothetical protein